MQSSSPVPDHQSPRAEPKLPTETAPSETSPRTTYPLPLDTTVADDPEAGQDLASKADSTRAASITTSGPESTPEILECRACHRLNCPLPSHRWYTLQLVGRDDARGIKSPRRRGASRRLFSIIGSQIDDGRSDPFVKYPIEMTPEMHMLFDGCKVFPHSVGRGVASSISPR